MYSRTIMNNEDIINTTLPTCDDTSNLQCQEVGRRKGVKEMVVIWVYTVDLV
jgi:hypothetical protein